jgi:hypothetical protein
MLAVFAISSGNCCKYIPVGSTLVLAQPIFTPEMPGKSELAIDQDQSGSVTGLV